MKIIKFKRDKVLDSNAQCNIVTEIDFDTVTKKPINFCLILIYHKEETIYEIIKYDGSHKICHVHKYFNELNSKGEDCLPSQINNISIIAFKQDILDNWRNYLSKYKKKWKI